MMDSPPPLVPADLDLRDFRWMPLDVVALHDSDLVDSTTPEEFRAAVLLWCKAWHQVPAASLPDRDTTLARFACLSMAEWMKVREGALRRFVKCSDGRLYHRVLAVKAIEAGSQQKGSAHRMRRSRLREEMGQPNLSAAECDAILSQRDASRDAQRDVTSDGEVARNCDRNRTRNVTSDRTGPDLTGERTPLPPATVDRFTRLAGLVVEAVGIDLSKDTTGRWMGSAPANEVAMWLGFGGGVLTDDDILAEVRAKPKPDISSLRYYRAQMQRLAEAKAGGTAAAPQPSGSTRDRSTWPLHYLDPGDPWTQADSDEHMRRYGYVPTRLTARPHPTPKQLVTLNELYRGAPDEDRRAQKLPVPYRPMTEEDFAHARQ